MNSNDKMALEPTPVFESPLSKEQQFIDNQLNLKAKAMTFTSYEELEKHYEYNYSHIIPIVFLTMGEAIKEIDTNWTFSTEQLKGGIAELRRELNEAREALYHIKAAIEHKKPRDIIGILEEYTGSKIKADLGPELNKSHEDNV